MKISFDYDGTLSRPDVQLIAKSLIDSGNDVWILTSRFKDDYNIDLIDVSFKVGIPINKILFTEGDYKHKEYVKNNFDLHYDDRWDEAFYIKKAGGVVHLVNPDFSDIFEQMQHEFKFIDK